MEILYKSHNEWIAIVKGFGEHNYAEDIVMESYIRIHDSKSIDKAVVNGSVNKAFMWVTLRNNVYNYNKAKSKIKKVELKDFKLKANNPIDRQFYISNDIMYDKIIDEMESWHWYDRELFWLITSGKVSMRKFSRESRISLSSVANTMNKCKKRLRLVIGEDYEDYVNKEYERIR